MRQFIFNSMVNKCGITGLKERIGYKVHLEGIELYAFTDNDDDSSDGGIMTYFVDPKTGLSICQFYGFGNTTDEVIDSAAKNIIGSDIIQKLKHKRLSEGYDILVQVYGYYEMALELKEKYDSLVE